MDFNKFAREVNILRIIKSKWNSTVFPTEFYYITDSDRLFDVAPIGSVRISEGGWLNIPDDEETNIGGIIVMRPASRHRLRLAVDSDGLIYSQLLNSLCVAHSAGILHCDLSPSNCLMFGSIWQVVDYGLAVQTVT